MSDAFDPYYKWLGIPPQDQPPDYYRLLGVKQFEPDEEVIATAADRQMMLVRTFQSGPRSEVSQRLLNELSAAKLCLLDRGQRAAYDQQLRGDDGPLAEAAPPSAPLAAIPADPATASPAITIGDESRRRAAWRKPVLVAVAAGGAILLLMVAWSMSGDRGPDLRFRIDGPPSVQVGQPWTARAELQDPAAAGAGVRFRLGSGAPVGMQIDVRSGQLSWRPRSPGLYELSVEATADGATTRSVAWQVRVVPPPPRPMLEPIADLVVPEGQPQRWPVVLSAPAATGAAVRFELAAAPEGMQLDDDAALRWTPSEAQGPGAYGVTVRLWLEGEREPGDEMSFRVTVGEANRGPAFAPIEDQTADVARPWRFQVVATDPDLPANGLTYRLIGAPKGMRIDAATGELSWTPPATVGASHRVTVSVRDDADDAGTASVSFRVLLRDGGAARRWRAFAGRRQPRKSELLGAGGGDARSEAAVNSALDWLARQQQPDGSWKLSGPYGEGAPLDNTAAATAMATLAFLAAGNTPAEGPHRRVVAEAALSLRKQQDVQGGFPLRNSHAKMYTHALGTMALCELYGMTDDEAFRQAAERAVKFCVDNQGREGGWRYSPRQRDSDTSVTGGVLLALMTARAAGLEVPQKTLDRVSAYLDLAAIDGGSRYAYLPHSATAKHTMTAEGLLARTYLGWQTDDARLQRGVAPLLEEALPNWNGRDVYLWYYATWLLHRVGGRPWERWNARMRDLLVENQVNAGAERGSWNPTGDKWGPHAGRLYTTCFSTYILQVYYRHPRPDAE